MAPVPSGGTIAVTGAAGFIGSWVVRLLLDKGYRVRACVRDANDGSKTDFLRALPGYSSGRLSIHSANLDDDGCFDDIFKGCNGVCHVSHVSTYDDHDYVRRVCGHIIDSVNKSGTVNRVIVTSSVAAVISEADIFEIARRPVLYEDRYPDESNPKENTGAGTGLFDGQGHCAAGVFGCRRGEWSLGCHHSVPCGQCWADSISPPEERWTLAAQY